MTISAKKALFVAETVSLAHISRPFVLAEALAKRGWEIHFATAPRYLDLFDWGRIRRWPLFSISSHDFLDEVARGVRPYSRALIERYVREDVALLRRLQPDVVVGDFRWSLSTSAALCRVPQVTIVNAYWSPWADTAAFAVPDTAAVRSAGVPLMNALFRLFLPVINRCYATPINQVRRAYGLPAFPDLRHALTAGDLVVFPDVPELVPVRRLPDRHAYIGALTWSPDRAAPAPGPASVYVTVGSSGSPELLPPVLEALARENLSGIVATAGHSAPEATIPPNVSLVDFLPAADLMESFEAVVCNGGSPSVYQALAAGVPVIGLPANLDQLLTMHHVTKAGAGAALRASTVTVTGLRAALRTVLHDARSRAAARRIGGLLRKYRASERFPDLIEALLAKRKQ